MTTASQADTARLRISDVVSYQSQSPAPENLTEYLQVSGDIAHGKTTAHITYLVFDRSDHTVVGNLTLPDKATFASRFSVAVKVPRRTDAYDVGLFNGAGEFVSANFELNLSDLTAEPTRAGSALS